MIRRTLLLAFVFGVAADVPSFAAEPKPCANDSRILCIAHDPSEVVHLSAAVGQTLRIELGKGEEIDGLFVSDQRLIGKEEEPPHTPGTGAEQQQAQAAATGTRPKNCVADPNMQRCAVGNFVYVMPRRPLDDEPFFLQSHWVDSTGKTRVEAYAFDVSTVPTTEKVASADGKAPELPKPYYAVRILYPGRMAEERAAQKKAAAEAWRAAHPAVPKAARPMGVAAQPCDQAGVNKRYAYRGPDALKPDRACDDGRSTYLIYNGNRTIPAVFTYAPDGQKTNGFGYAVEPGPFGNTIRIARTAARWCVEYGPAMGCILNAGSDPEGRASSTVASAGR